VLLQGSVQAAAAPATGTMHVLARAVCRHQQSHSIICSSGVCETVAAIFSVVAVIDEQ